MRRALPWLLLALSLAVILRLTFHERPRAEASQLAKSRFLSTGAAQTLDGSQRPTPGPQTAPARGHAPSAGERSINAPGPGGQQAAANALARWIATAPADALEWLGQQEDGPAHDPAALQISTYFLARADFANAQIWAELIRDPALSLQARTAVFVERYRAHQIDNEAILRSGLPPKTITAILDGSLLD